MQDSYRETGFMLATTRGFEMDLDECIIANALIELRTSSTLPRCNEHMEQLLAMLERECRAAFGGLEKNGSVDN
jgi:hypothetical protein